MFHADNGDLLDKRYGKFHWLGVEASIVLACTSLDLLAARAFCYIPACFDDFFVVNFEYLVRLCNWYEIWRRLPGIRRNWSSGNLTETKLHLHSKKHVQFYFSSKNGEFDPCLNLHKVRNPVKMTYALVRKVIEHLTFVIYIVIFLSQCLRGVVFFYLFLYFDGISSLRDKRLA